MNQLNLTKKQIIGGVITLILLIGIGVGVYLVQVQHIFKSRASMEGIEVRTSSGAGVDCDKDNNCVTDNPEDVTVTVNKEYFENLEIANP